MREKPAHRPRFWAVAILLFGCWLPSSRASSECVPDSSRPQRDISWNGANYSLRTPCVHTFRIAGDTKRVVVYSTRLPTGDPDPASDVDDWADQIAVWTADFWTRYATFEFESPRRRVREGVDEVEIAAVPGGGGNAGGGRPYVITGHDPLPGNPLAFRQTLGHELLHAIQQNMPDLFPSGEVGEGTADLAPDLLFGDLDQAGFGCAGLFLPNTDQTMWERPSPGRDNSSLCHTIVYFRYLTEQLGTISDEPQRGIDALAGLHRALSANSGWRLGAGDRLESVGRFSDDRRDVAVFRSERYLGFLRLDGRDPASLDVTLEGGRFGDGWKLAASDEVLAVGNFTGGDREELLIRSATHLGILGLDGRGGAVTLAAWLHGRLIPPRTRDGAVHGERAAERLGWRLQPTDLIAGAGDLYRRPGERESDARTELIVHSDEALAILGVDESGEPVTLAKVRNGGRFGGQWKLAAGDRVQGVGDFDGDGRDELILRSAGYLGIVGLDEAGDPTTLTARANEARFGDGWKLARGDEILGVGDVASGRGEEFIIRSPGYLGIIGLAGRELVTVAVRANRARWGLWRLRSGDRLEGVGDLDGDGREELVVRGGRALGALGLDGASRPVSLGIAPLGAQFGARACPDPRNCDWRLRRGDRVLGLGDFDGDGRTDIVLRREGRLGVVGWAGTNQPVTLWTLGDGMRFRSLLEELDAFIQSSSGGERTFKSLWRDFTVANYAKELTGPLVTPVYSYFDEQQPPGSMGLVSLETAEGRFEQPRWSARYFHEPPLARASRLTVTVTQAQPEDELAFTIAVVENDRLVRMIERRGGDLSEVVALDAGQELVTVATAFATPVAYTYRVETAPR